MSDNNRHETPSRGRSRSTMAARFERAFTFETPKRPSLKMIIERLERGGVTSVECPAHDDGTPSLSVRKTDQSKVLLHCHAGCSTEDVLRAGGLPWDVLSSESEVEGTYVYRSAEGKPLARLIRRAGKKFIWERAVGDAWSPGLEGLQLPIYRLPEIQEALARDETIFLVEGEKCADALVDAGLQATTTPNGAGGWKERYSAYFGHGRHILVIPDNDGPGRAYAGDVQDDLRRAGNAVDIVSLPGLPPKGDVIDYLAAGHSLDDLLQVIESRSPEPAASPRGYADVTDLLKKDLPTPKPLVNSLLTPGLYLLVGPPKIGKSFFTLQLARDVAEGREAFGSLRVQKSHVLLFALEDSERRLKNRLATLGVKPEPGTFRYEHRLCGLEQGGYEELEAALDADPRIGLVVIDTLGKVLPAVGRSGNAYLHDVRHVGRLQEIVLRRNVCLLAVHHTRKASDTDFVSSVSGTTGIAGSADGVISLARGRQASLCRLQLTGRDLEEADLAFEFNRTVWTLIGPWSEHGMTGTSQAILDLVRGGPRSTKDLIELVQPRMSPDTIRKAVSRLAGKGLLQLDLEGRYCIPVATTS